MLVYPPRGVKRVFLHEQCTPANMAELRHSNSKGDVPMASGSFKCSKCDRSFKMAAHLARHQRSHGGGRKSPIASKGIKRGPGRPKGSRNTRPSTMMSTGSGPAHLLSQMQAYCSDLFAQRATLDTQIAKIEDALSTLGGAMPAGRAIGTRRGPGRPKGSMRSTGGPRPGTLKDVIVRVLSQRSSPLAPKDIADSVIRAGYKTKTKDLSKTVSNTLPTMKNVKRVDRGLYTV